MLSSFIPIILSAYHGRQERGKRHTTLPGEHDVRGDGEFTYPPPKHGLSITLPKPHFMKLKQVQMPLSNVWSEVLGKVCRVKKREGCSWESNLERKKREWWDDGWEDGDRIIIIFHWSIVSMVFLTLLIHLGLDGNFVSIQIITAGPCCV